MDAKQATEKILEAVRTMFKAEFEEKATETKEPVKFEMTEEDVAKVQELINSAVEPLVAKIAELEGGEAKAEEEATEMKKQLDTLKAEKAELETKLAAQPIEEPTVETPPVQSAAKAVEVPANGSTNDRLTAIYSNFKL